jgi:hypothetical protein
MNKLTPAQRRAYLKNPHLCPKCGQSDLTVGDWDPEIHSQIVECHNNTCEFTFREIFKMVDIEVVN